MAASVSTSPAISPEPETKRAVYRGKEEKLLLGTEETLRGLLGVGLYQNHNCLNFCAFKKKVGSWALTLESLGCESLESLLPLEEQQVWIFTLPMEDSSRGICHPQVSQESVRRGTPE